MPKFDKANKVPEINTETIAVNLIGVKKGVWILVAIIVAPLASPLLKVRQQNDKYH